MTAQTIGATALQTAAAVLPALAASDPKVAAAVAATNVAMTLFQAAMDAHNAELMTSDQLVALFATVGPRVQSTHEAWAAMNAADAAAGVTA